MLYEDNHLLAVNKPAGLLTQPSGTEQESLEALAKQWLKEKYQKPGNVFLEAVHRIDKPVSGIVLFAKTSKALGRLNSAMRSKDIQKVYLAMVEGVPTLSNGILEHYLIHDDYKARVVEKDGDGAKLARLSYRTLKTQHSQALLEIVLETGRYHQIRVQMAAIGHPVIGDLKYGSTKPLPNGAIFLHHSKLSMVHPITGEVLAFQSIPEWIGECE